MAILTSSPSNAQAAAEIASLTQEVYQSNFIQNQSLKDQLVQLEDGSLQVDPKQQEIVRKNHEMAKNSWLQRYGLVDHV